MVTAQAERNKEDDLLVDENDHTLVVLSLGEMEAIHNVKIPRSPNDWSHPPAKTEKGEPQFELIDNPGGWSSFTFRPEFDKGIPADSQYTVHTLPTSATTVPKGENGQRKCGGWNLYYGGLENENPKYNVRSGYRPANFFSE